ncbi:MAG: hypothetical protein WC942_09165 [Clostridia bacterium]|jgi:CRISPR-associated protein Cst2
MIKHIYGTVLTYESPAANNRSTSEENCIPLQVLSSGNKTYSIISSLSIKNRLRYVLGNMGYEMNRSRSYIPENPQPSVKYDGKADPEKYLDDHIFGYVVTKIVDLGISNGKMGENQR